MCKTKSGVAGSVCRPTKSLSKWTKTAKWTISDDYCSGWWISVCWMHLYLRNCHKIDRTTQIVNKLGIENSLRPTQIESAVECIFGTLSTTISHINAGWKQHSIQWRHSSSTKPKKFMQIPHSSRKWLIPFFWVNNYSWRVLLTKLRRVVQIRRRGKLSADVILLHDKVRSNTTSLAKKIENFTSEFFDHIVPTLHLATSSSSCIGQQFKKRELKTVVAHYFTFQAETSMHRVRETNMPLVISVQVVFSPKLTFWYITPWKY